MLGYPPATDLALVGVYMFTPSVFEAARAIEAEVGRVIIGQGPGARLPVPVYESAFALARWLDENSDREKTTITIINPGPPGSEFDDRKLTELLAASLQKRRIEYLPNLQVTRVTSSTVITDDGRQLDYNLLMLLPPFRGSSAASRLGITSGDDYINVDWSMKVIGLDRMYAAGDCVNLSGPKMGHLAVHQGEVAAANLAAEIAGHDVARDLGHVVDALQHAAWSGRRQTRPGGATRPSAGRAGRG